jgi:L-galactose dehydrogenase
MQKVVLGRTGLDVSVVCLGAGGHSRLGQRQGVSADHSVNVVRAALDLGINFIDTAPAYGTEEIVGTALKGRRDNVVVSTKVRANRPGSAMDTSTDLTTPAELIASVDNSLKLLATDRIDILHMHGIRPNQYDHCVNVLVPVMIDLRKAGKIRFLGITEGFGVDQERVVMDRSLDDGHWDVLMLGYNLANPSATRSVLPKAQAKNIGTMCMYAVRGALVGKETAQTLVAGLIKSGEIDPATVDADDPLGFIIASGEAASQTEAAYRFCRHTPGIGAVMTGTGSVDHLKQNVASIQGPPLRPETLKRLEAIFGRVISATGDLPENKRTA